MLTFIAWALMAATAAAEHCLDSQDQVIWFSSGQAGFGELLSSCGQQCTAEANCTAHCVQQRAGYSLACAGCMGGLAACSDSQCLKTCRDSQSCEDCIRSKCEPIFAKCSGLGIFKPRPSATRIG
eukprot:gb/GFBE01009603.1/.p1 GENE.gb/GFBE01009603.1/~~gb/GFBE01009603.1/.p1  ORF type:complete len:125 (+),score=20.57 gb/GFBE01009603.1/:1-375(+)